jgi:hypothetical protein
MQDALGDLLKRRRDRAIAIILSIKERECDEYLPRETRVKLRKVVLDQFNEFYDLVLDLMSSLDQGDVVLNEEYLVKLDNVHRDVSEIRSMLTVAAEVNGG